MKRDFQMLLKAFKSKANNKYGDASDKEKVAQVHSKHKHNEKLYLLKMWKGIISNKKLSKSTLDNIALLTGFQNWDDFKSALQGECDAELNYEDNGKKE